MSIFLKIVDRQIPADIVWEDERVIAFRDIHPQAPTHVLVVPKRLIAGVSAADEDDEPLLGHLLTACRKVAEVEGIATSGYRLVINDGKAAGQEVPHLHVHLLGGRGFGWPPG